MLRSILLVIGIAMLGAAPILALCHAPLPAVIWLSVWGILLVGGLLFERGRYKPAERGQPGPGWIATDECFVDPHTGERVTVFYQPSSGERRYIGR
jgi:hypothetical protein